jgi:hypothetical protein
MDWYIQQAVKTFVPRYDVSLEAGTARKISWTALELNVNYLISK